MGRKNNVLRMLKELERPCLETFKTVNAVKAVVKTVVKTVKAVKTVKTNCKVDL